MGNTATNDPSARDSVVNDLPRESMIFSSAYLPMSEDETPSMASLSI